MGTEQLWLIGDDLVRYTAGQALSARNDTYIYNMFETNIYASSPDDAARAQAPIPHNPISKLINNFAKAIKREQNNTKMGRYCP